MSLFGGIKLTGRPDLENIRKLDLLPIPQINRMSRYGIAIDIPYLKELSLELASEMVDLQKQISSYVPLAALNQFSVLAAEIEDTEGRADVNANSAIQIRTLLFDLLSVGKGRDLKQTSDGKVSTGKKNLELSKADHPVVPLVLQYRERAKLKSAFTDSLPLKARYHPAGDSCPVCELSHVESTWRVHTTFTTTRAETGRFSSKNPNLQQIPTRSELGGRIRKAFYAAPGKKIVSTDFSQVELRDLAHMSAAASMIRVYQEDKDIHIYTACRAFGHDYDKYALLAAKKEAKTLTDQEKAIWSDFALNCRLPSKNLNFMIVYGASWKGLQAQLALSGILWDERQCQDFIDRWFNLYPEVQAYLDQQAYRARRYGFVWTPCGRIRLVPEVRSCHSYIRSAGIRQAGNMPVQGCSAEQTKLVMGELEQDFLEMHEQQGIWVWPLLTIHDQVMVEAEEDYAELICDVMKTRFSEVMWDKQTGEDLWRVPIKSDGEILDRWVKG